MNAYDARKRDASLRKIAVFVGHKCIGWIKPNRRDTWIAGTPGSEIVTAFPKTKEEAITCVLKLDGIGFERSQIILKPIVKSYI